MTFQSPLRKLLRAGSVAFTVLCLSPVAHAELDKASQEALEKTQALLKDRTQRTEAMKGNDSAKQNQQSLEGFAGNAGNVDAVYGISAEIFGSLAKDSNGDTVSMQQKLEQAQKNPEAFLRSLSSEQKASIERLAKKIEQEQGTTGKP